MNDKGMTQMSNAFRKVVSASLFALLAAGGISPALADSTTNSFARSDHDGNGVIDVEEYRARMIEIFVFLDKDGDGYLLVVDVPDGYKEVFPVADTDGDGRASLREYLLFIMPRFWKADYDGNNVLSLPEVGAADRREAASY
jgi:hypothetical protein